MAHDIIYMVLGDSYPEPNFTLKDMNAEGADPSDSETWPAIDLSAGTTTVSVKIREQGGAVLLATVACTKIGTGVDGQVFMPVAANLFPNAGTFEGEIVINFNGATQTVYDKIKFKVRESL